MAISLNVVSQVVTLTISIIVSCQILVFINVTVAGRVLVRLASSFACFIRSNTTLSNFATGNLDGHKKIFI